MANAGIYSAFMPRERSVDDGYNALAQRDHNALLMQSQVFDMQQKQQAIQQENALKQAVMATNGDPAAMRQAFVSTGNAAMLAKHDAAQAQMAKEASAAKASEAQAAEHGAKATVANLDILTRKFAAVDPMDNNALADVLAQSVALKINSREDAEASADKVMKMTPGERMKWYAAQIGMGQSAKEKAEAQAQAEARAETAKHNRNTEANAAATLGETQRTHRVHEGLAGGNLSVARERLNLDKQAANGVEYKQDNEGNWVALPKKPVPGAPITSTAVVDSVTGKPTGAGTKLGEGAKKQVSGIDALSGAIDEYKAELKNFAKIDALNPDARARIGSKYNNMMLQAKEAYNLGVLNGPDYQILTSVVTDPLTLKGTITSNKAMDEQATELDRMMQRTRAAVTNQGRPSAAKAAPLNIDHAAIDAELARRKK